MLWRSQYRIFHMKPAVICHHAPHRIKLVPYISFRSPVFNLAGILVQHTATIWIWKTYNEIFTIDIEHIESIGQTIIHKTLGKRKLIIPKFLRFQIRILRRKHIHFTNGRITESLTCHCFDFCILRKMESQPHLRNELCTRLRMIIYSCSGIQRKPCSNILTKIYITCYFIQRLIRRSFTMPIKELVPCLTAKVKIISSYSQSVALEKLYALIP